MSEFIKRQGWPDIPVGVVLGPQMGMWSVYEVFYRPNLEDGLQTARNVLDRTIVFGTQAGYNLKNELQACKFVVYNDRQHEYVAFEMSGLYRHESKKNAVWQTISLFFANEKHLQATLAYEQSGRNAYKLIEPDFLQIDTGEYSLQLNGHYQYVRAYASHENLLPRTPSLTAATNQVLADVEGNPIDPYQVMYGQMNDEDIIRRHLGKQVTIDQDSDTITQIVTTGIWHKERKTNTFPYRQKLENLKATMAQELYKYPSNLSYNLKAASEKK